MVENCDNCACFPVCDRKFNMFGVFMGWADCNNWIPEVKRGKWVADRYCSNCEYDRKERLFDQYPNYCPNCGATMCKE